MGILLGFAKQYWMYIVIALVVAGTLGYIKILQIERDHYKAQRDSLQAAFDQQKVAKEELQQEFDVVTRQFRDADAAWKQDRDHQKQELNRAYRDNKELRAKLAATPANPDVVRVFNDSVQGQPNGATAPPVSVSGDASSTKVCSEDDLLTAAVANNQAADDNAHQVEQWQRFWKDYLATLQKREAMKNGTP